ncbi:MAG: flagellar basal body P-ring formation protein FlgA [Acidobacteriota bacterium]|nr:flagellar basal body P-ring formation protein FlgA [Acidobacteriota bacterium]
MNSINSGTHKGMGRLPALMLAVVLIGLTQRPLQAAIPAKLVLPAHVLLHSRTLTLADLLPASAPAKLRTEAGKIRLGEAPQPPMTRIVYRQQLQFLLKDHAPLLANLSVPAEIRIQRAYREITRAEVIRVIDRDLESFGLKQPPDLSNLEFTAPVYATGENAGLKLIRVFSDPTRGVTSFRLWTSKEPVNLPFTVTIPREIKLPTLVARRRLADGDIASPADFTVEMRPATGAMKTTNTDDVRGLEVRGLVRAGAPVNRDQFKRPVLVEPGALATLVVQGNGFSIKTIVTPLEQGVFGQEIRVRNNESRLVVEARVTGRDRLVKPQE